MRSNGKVRERLDGGVSLGPFLVDYAVGAGSRVEEYRLRYRAFVEEHQWEAADGCANGLERDEFDEFCCALLLTDAVTGEAAACQRLILPEWLPGCRVTNLERQYRPSPGMDGVDFARLPRDSWAEVSRSTIAPPYRWGSSTTTLPAMIAIKLSSIALAVALDRQALFSLSDLRTARLARRMGFRMAQVGQAIDFHGMRAPFRIDVAEVLHSVGDDWRQAVERLIEYARIVVGSEPRDGGRSAEAA